MEVNREDANEFYNNFEKLKNMKTYSGREPLDKYNKKQYDLSPHLNNVILKQSSYSDTLLQFASMLWDAYMPIKERRKRFNINGEEVFLRPLQSTQEWSWFENNSVVILAIHGADNNEKTMFALKGFLKPNQETELYTPFLNKYRKALKTQKQVYLIGHSLGGSAVGYALKSGGNGLGCVFAPYVNRIDDSVSRYLASSPNIKKLFFDTDWLSTTLMKLNPVNLIVYKNFDPHPMNIMSGHYIRRFLKNPPSQELPLNPTNKQKLRIMLERFLFKKKSI